jgi:ribosomal protein L7/L12
MGIIEKIKNYSGRGEMSDSHQEIEKITIRLEKLESQMAFLQRSLGITTNEAPGWKASPEIIEMVQRGDTIAAIKAFREQTGASLKDAKNFIESIK